MTAVPVWGRGDVASPPALARLLHDLAAAGQTVATAESLTGGLLVGALTDVPGASRVVRGGVVAYDSRVKAAVLGVDDGLLASGGAVQAPVALQLARGARDLLGATWGVGTTGVAGPDRSDGQEVGTVFVGVAGPGRAQVRRLDLAGLDRAAIRAGSVAGALRLLAETSCAQPPAPLPPAR